MTTNAQIKANRNNARNPPVPAPTKAKPASRRTLSNTDSSPATPSFPVRTLPTSTPNSLLSKPISNPPTPSNSNSFAKSPMPNGACAASRAWRPASSAAALADQRYLTEKYHPERLRPGYDGETLLLGSAIIGHTQTLVHLARYDGHLSRRFFRAVKQLADLRRDESKAHQARTSAGSHTHVDPDPYRGRYVPAQAPPPIDTPHPTAGRIGFRISRESTPQAGLPGGRPPAQQTTLTQNTKQTQFRRTPVKSRALRMNPVARSHF